MIHHMKSKEYTLSYICCKNNSIPRVWQKQFYCIHLDATQKSEYHNSKQKFVITSYQPKIYVSSNTANVLDSCTNMLTLEHNYHNNSENIVLCKV